MTHGGPCRYLLTNSIEEYQDGGESRFGWAGWEERDEDEDEDEEVEDKPLATTATASKAKRQRLQDEEEEEDEPLTTTATTPKSKRPHLELPLGALMRWEGKKKYMR